MRNKLTLAAMMVMVMTFTIFIPIGRDGGGGTVPPPTASCYTIPDEDVVGDWLEICVLYTPNVGWRECTYVYQMWQLIYWECTGE